MSRRILALASVVVLAAGLAACGKVGRLERPAPLFGAGRHSTPATEEAPGRAQDPSKPVDTVDPRDRSGPPTTPPVPALTPPTAGAGPQ